METNTINNCTIHNSKTGESLGAAQVDSDNYANACDNPEGHVRADSILGDEDLARLGISGDLTVYAILH